MICDVVDDNLYFAVTLEFQQVSDEIDCHMWGQSHKCVGSSRSLLTSIVQGTGAWAKSVLEETECCMSVSMVSARCTVLYTRLACGYGCMCPHDELS